MSTVIDAVYQGGVFRPAVPPALPDGTAVRLTVMPAAQADPLDPAAVLARIRAIATKANVTGVVETTSRDHDQILYGGPGGAR